MPEHRQKNGCVKQETQAIVGETLRRYAGSTWPASSVHNNVRPLPRFQTYLLNGYMMVHDNVKFETCPCEDFKPNWQPNTIVQLHTSIERIPASGWNWDVHVSKF